MTVQRKTLKYLLFMLCAYLCFYGCAFFTTVEKEPTAQEKALDDHFYILNSEQKRTIKTFTSKKDIDNFFEKFWQAKDPTPGTPENEIKDEYYRRLEYAKMVYVKDGFWKRLDDRLRVYLIYGQPDYIEYPFVTACAMDIEIWLYDIPVGKIHTPTIFDNIYPGQKKFIFADRRGFGIYNQIYSTEQGEIIDSRIFIFKSKYSTE